ncbi:MAG: transketolase C-terminal domain-containing protein, partial [Ornithinimicrobium sp.]|uniref:transketolase C-terminal domain-containing protein n=1 Tax=Ornithinimicrobium sp. TaxID=1977084 RepID=UPI0026E07514
GIVVAVPSGPAEAPGLLRCLVGLAEAEGRVCVLVEPIALYHRKDLAAPYPPPADWSSCTPSLGETMLHSAEPSLVGEVLVITFGNGVAMTRAALADPQIAHLAGRVDVLDLRWIVPLPAADLLRHAADYTSVLVVDESRRSGGVSEGVVTVLVDAGYAGQIRRVCSLDSLVPLGPAAATVLLSVDDIVQGLARSAERQAM